MLIISFTLIKIIIKHYVSPNSSYTVTNQQLYYILTKNQKHIYLAYYISIIYTYTSIQLYIYSLKLVIAINLTVLLL